MYNYSFNNNINFRAHLDTAKVLEVTAQKIFQSDGIEGCKEVLKALSDKPIKATGHRGYKYYAQEIGKKITEKYPEIAKATAEIKDIVKKNPKLEKKDLREKIQPLIDNIGHEIDITI